MLIHVLRARSQVQEVFRDRTHPVVARRIELVEMANFALLMSISVQHGPTI